MRCPKCHYISFDDSDRCRNCGYEFSLSVDADALDLPIQTGNEAIGPLSDFALGHPDGPAAGGAGTTQDPPGQSRTLPGSREAAPGSASSRRSITGAADLPLFKDRTFDDDTPLVTPPAIPRAPLAVRRSSPTAPRAPRSAAEEPELDLEPPAPDADDEVRQPQSGLMSGQYDARATYPAAGIGPRVLAGAIDLVILAGIDTAVLYFTLKICGFSRSELLLLPATPLVAFLALLNGGYFVAFIAAGGQTIGKMAGGIKVVPADAETSWTDRVPVGTAFVRAAAYLVSIVTRRCGSSACASHRRSPRGARSPRAHARCQSVTRLAVFIATVGYCGYFPIAPGTVGSAAGLVVYLLVWWTRSPLVEIGLIAGLFAAGVWAGTIAERYFGGIDPGPIVMDEVVGMLITLAFIPVGWSGALAGFVLFRLFDVVKPYPAGRFEQLHGGLGVMADDAMAAIYANITLRLVMWLLPGWIS